MTLVHLVDAFTDRAFGGNPAGVCRLEAARDDAWMQGVAAELRASATAFLVRNAVGWDVRWFTPAAEVKLCGHATLAAAHVLWESGALAAESPARFATPSGPIAARRVGGSGDRAGSRIELDFPARREREHAPIPELFAALGAEPVRFGKNEYDFVAELADESTVRALTPDLAAIRRLPVRGVIVTARAETGRPYDFVSRFFAPGVGLDEDPVTGSAHCCLGPYWSERLGRPELVGYQASRRGGVVHVRPEGDRVVLGGTAVTVLTGELAPGVAARGT